jgi:hypothetical protein
MTSLVATFTSLAILVGISGVMPFLASSYALQNSTDTNSEYTTSYQIPRWVKIIAGWSATGQISHSEFSQAIQYMINKGIIIVQSNDPTVTNSTIVENIFNHLETQNATKLSSTPTTNSEKVTVSPPTSTSSMYDQEILGDRPVLFLTMNAPNSGTQIDLSGNGHTGTYEGGTPEIATMPNGDNAPDFHGATQYLTVPSSPALSIPTTGTLTWEGWIRPDVLNFVNSGNGYVDWMGKCQSYSPTCEWEARLYDTNNTQDRYNRFSGYVFNPTAGLGSGADWQPSTIGMIKTGQWYYVTVEYSLLSQPADCPASTSYPGSINIWVDGVEWEQTKHGTTGCFSQYSVKPVAGNSPLNIGTMAFDNWFQGGIGKVAIYNYLLTPTQITNHYFAMTGHGPSGSCSAKCTLSGSKSK